MAELRSNLSAPLLRGLESLLPVSVLLTVLYPIAFVRAVIHQLYKRPNPLQLPPIMDSRPPRARLLRLSMYLNRMFEFIPDRMNSPKWRARCRYVGFEPVLEALAAGTPVIFTFPHFGPYSLMRRWLCAKGIRAVMITGRDIFSPSPLDQRKNEWASAAGIPPAFHLDQLSDVVREFKKGNPLTMAFDARHNREVTIPLPDGSGYRVATGAIRLAKKYGARLFPCVLYNTGPWRFTFEMAPAVPTDALEQDDQIAAQDIVSKLLPIFMQHPDQWNTEMLDQFVPSSTTVTS